MAKPQRSEEGKSGIAKAEGEAFGKAFRPVPAQLEKTPPSGFQGTEKWPVVRAPGGRPDSGIRGSANLFDRTAGARAQGDGSSLPHFSSMCTASA